MLQATLRGETKPVKRRECEFSGGLCERPADFAVTVRPRDFTTEERAVCRRCAEDHLASKPSKELDDLRRLASPERWRFVPGGEVGR